MKSGRCGEARPAPNGEEGAGGPGWLVGSLGSRLPGGQVREGALGGTGLPSSLLSCSEAQAALAAAGRSRWTGSGCELARSLPSGGPDRAQGHTAGSSPGGTCCQLMGPRRGRPRATRGEELPAGVSTRTSPDCRGRGRERRPRERWDPRTAWLRQARGDALLGFWWPFLTYPGLPSLFAGFNTSLPVQFWKREPGPPWLKAELRQGGLRATVDERRVSRARPHSLCRGLFRCSELGAHFFSSF